MASESIASNVAARKNVQLLMISFTQFLIPVALTWGPRRFAAAEPSRGASPVEGWIHAEPWENIHQGFEIEIPAVENEVGEFRLARAGRWRVEGTRNTDLRARTRVRSVCM